MAPNYTTPGELMRQENRRIIDDAKKKGDWEFFKTSIGLNAGALADALGAFNGASGPARGAMGNLGQAPSAPQSRVRYTWEGGDENAAPQDQNQNNTGTTPDQYRAWAKQNGALTPPGRTSSSPALASADNSSSPSINWTTGKDGRRTATWTVPGTDQRAGITLTPRSGNSGTGANIGYDPQEARQAQASPYYQQIGPDTYMTNRGLMIQGDKGVADYFSRFRHGGSIGGGAPLPWEQQTAQPQMPEAPRAGWKTAKAVYQTQMDAYNKAQDRQQTMDIAQMQDARAAEQLGFQQEQARQQMELARMGHGLQAGHLANETAKAAWEQEAAAMGLEHQRALLGARQKLMAAFASGNAEAVKKAQQELQALTAEKGTEKEKSPTYRKGSWTDPITGDEKERWFQFDGATATPVEVQRTPQDQAYDQARQMAMQDPRIAERIRKAKTPQEVQAIYDTLIQANAGKGAKK